MKGGREKLAAMSGVTRTAGSGSQTPEMEVGRQQRSRKHLSGQVRSARYRHAARHPRASLWDFSLRDLIELVKQRGASIISFHAAGHPAGVHEEARLLATTVRTDRHGVQGRYRGAWTRSQRWSRPQMLCCGPRTRGAVAVEILVHAEEPEHVQRGLDESRFAEWEKWQKHAAADSVPEQEAAQLMAEGAE